jgi:hypothetical protein
MVMLNDYWTLTLKFMDLCFTTCTLSSRTLAYRHLLLVGAALFVFSSHILLALRSGAEAAWDGAGIIDLDSCISLHLRLS